MDSELENPITHMPKVTFTPEQKAYLVHHLSNGLDLLRLGNSDLFPVEVRRTATLEGTSQLNMLLKAIRSRV